MKPKILDTIHRTLAASPRLSRRLTDTRISGLSVPGLNTPFPRLSLPFGTLWDPTLLDRLHAPVTRRHE